MQKRTKDSSLADLVASLTKTERRYFKLEIQGEGKKNRVTREVFEALLQNPEVKEEEWKEKMASAPFSKHFSATKYQVLERLLRSMRSYHSGSNVDARLRALLDDIAFLHGKGLWPLLRKRLRKALNIARQFERFRIQLDLLQWERRLHFHRHDGQFQNALQELDRQSETLFQQIRNESMAEILHTGILALSKRTTRLRRAEELAEMEQLLAPLHELDQHQGGSFFVDISLLNVKGLRAFLLGEYTDAIQFFEAALELWKNRPEMLRIHLDHYRISLTNYANCCFYLNRLQDLHAAMDSMRQLRDLPPQDLLQFETTRYHLELLHSLNLARFEHGLALLDDLEDWMERKGKQVQAARLMLIRYNAVLLQFMAGEHRGAKRWLEEILYKTVPGQREDIYEFAHFVELMLHYESEDWELMHSRLVSLNRRARINGWEKGFLAELLRMFRMLGRVGEGQRRALFADRLERMQSIVEEPGKPPFGLQETLFWMESKLKGVSLREYLKNKVAMRP